VIRRHNDVRIVIQAEPPERRLDQLKCAVGIPNGSERGRTVDAGIQTVETIALVVLCAIGIA